MLDVTPTIKVSRYSGGVQISCSAKIGKAFEAEVMDAIKEFTVNNIAEVTIKLS